MKTTVDEMNLKIAEWMGEAPKWFIDECSNDDDFFESEEDAEMFAGPGSEIFPLYPFYHSDWNALMPVVERMSEKSPALNILGTLHNLIYDYSDNGFNSIADLHQAIYNYIKQTS